VPSRRQWTLAATIIGSSLTFVDGTAVNVALPALQAAFQATLTDVQWVIEAYALFLGALVLVGGSIGDQFGRKRVFVFGVALFTLASIGCGMSPSVEVLIAARAIQGVGAALLVPGSLAIISAAFDDAERGRAIGLWSSFSAMTAALGPIVGGWLIEHVSWRAVFFINVPLAAMVLVLSARFMDESRDPMRVGHVDWWGGALAVLGLGGLVFGLLEWPREAAVRALACSAIGVGAICLGLLLAVERRVRNPMLPLGLFASSTFTLTNILTLLLYGALGIILFIIPLNLIQVQHYTATMTGAALLPFPVIMFLLSRWSGGLVSKVGSRLPLMVGPAIGAVGLALFAWPGIGGSYWTTFFPATAILGLGMAVTVAPLTTTVMGAVAREHAGVASGINNAVARVAGLLAVAVLGLALVSAFDARAAHRLDGLKLTRDVRAGVDRELAKMADADVRTAVVNPTQQHEVETAIAESFVDAFRLVSLAAAALAVAAACVAAGIRG
jgi:EmrB/QacA subfamily drug resistance transporter